MKNERSRTNDDGKVCTCIGMISFAIYMYTGDKKRNW